jgi:hypothetical protein
MNVREAIQREATVAALLQKGGRKVSRNGYVSPCDFIIDGRHVELKSAEPSKKLRWFFNIHRHGKIDEIGVDWYILRFEGIPGVSYALHALVKAPIGLYALRLSFRALIKGEMASAFAAFDVMRKTGKWPDARG